MTKAMSKEELIYMEGMEDMIDSIGDLCNEFYEEAGYVMGKMGRFNDDND